MNRARILMVSLEEAIQAGANDPSLVASVETAYAAWELTRTSPARVARIAHLVSRAFDAIRGAPRPLADQEVRGCAHILFTGLPASAREKVNFPKIVSIVHGLQRETDSWTAVVKATAEILGWTGVGLTHAGHVIRVAMATQIEPLG